MDNLISSLAREVTQNSLDAHNDQVNVPTEVTYEVFKLDTNLVPGICQIKKSILPDAINFWREKNDVETLKFLREFQDTLEQKQIDVLKISDFNTKGLDSSSYESLVLGESYSVKSSEDSAGSKGIGKAAPFATSNLRMVFYNSLAVEGQERSAGVMNFVSYKFNDSNKLSNDYTQDSISFYDKDKQVIQNQQNFGQEKRQFDNPGTDLFT